MASSSCSLASHPLNYDVFLNFRGEDTRRGFTSHLCAALRRKALQTFFDDDDLKRGEEIAQSLPRAIQYSTVAILVFSKDYASSSWCLDELAEIIERHRFHGQIVLPIFYEVDPSHLRKQSHNVAAAFVKHKQNPMNAQKIPRWNDALITAASLSGFDSKNFGNDDLLINKIVEDILQKLNQSMPRDDFEHLVGMDSRIKEIKEVFTINPFKARILGIWGMGGIGKTTIATVIYQMMSRQFEGCCFLDNVGQRADNKLYNKLWEELILKIFGEKASERYTLDASLHPFLKERLGRKKVLLVLEDVNNSDQIEFLIGDSCWFSSGSMILITSRDKHVFEGRADFIYEVKLLNVDESLQLFNKRAFKQNYPRDDYASLSNAIVKYAQGNPLALKVLGSALNGKNLKEWESALTQLSKDGKKEIQQVLQISYNGLSRVEQDIFLDIACFFKHGEQIYVTEDTLRKIYKSSGFDIDITLSVLEDKGLVTSKDSLKMHDLLQEMGKEIVRQEAKYSYQRSRLWDPQDIYEVFVGNKEAEAVESIVLDSSKIREMNLNPRVFMKMPNLRFLNFFGESNLYLSQGLDYLPNTLRYLSWDEYPLQSFPPNFHPGNLVVLELFNSNIKQFWNNTKENSMIPQLKYSMSSMIVNDFGRLAKLTSLSLAGNEGITNLPNSRSGFLEALEFLNLNGCSNLNTFPEISSNIKNLFLCETAIKQVPSSSIELLSKLEYLTMRDCKELENLPSNFFSKLTSLELLYMHGCSSLKALPEILKPKDNLKHFSFSGTAIKKLPSSIHNLKGLKKSMTMPHWFHFYPRSFFEYHHILGSSLEGMPLLPKLILSNCNLTELPEDLGFLSSVKSLILSENDFEKIPATIKQLSQLKILYLYNCQRLLSLPELPSSLSQLWANGCRSLKQISTLKQLHLDSQECPCMFGLYNCFMLDEDECQAVVNALLRAYVRNQLLDFVMFYPGRMIYPGHIHQNFVMFYPGSRMPEWVKYQSMGDSIRIRISSHWFNHLLLGFAFYLCHENIEFDGGRGRVLTFRCQFTDSPSFSDSSPIYSGPCQIIDKEHMVVWISKGFCAWVRERGNFKEDVATFTFSLSGSIVNKCGIIPLYTQENQDEFCHTFNFPTPTSMVQKKKKKKKKKLNEMKPLLQSSMLPLSGTEDTP